MLEVVRISHSTEAPSRQPVRKRLEPWDYAARYVATHQLFPLALSELLRTRQRFLIHAAAVAGPRHGVLLVGDSEAGKSTLSYRALRCGYRCVADDGVLICADAEGGFVAYPFYRQFSVDPAIL